MNENDNTQNHVGSNDLQGMLAAVDNAPNRIEMYKAKLLSKSAYHAGNQLVEMWMQENEMGSLYKRLSDRHKDKLLVIIDQELHTYNSRQVSSKSMSQGGGRVSAPNGEDTTPEQKQVDIATAMNDQQFAVRMRARTRDIINDAIKNGPGEQTAPAGQPAAGHRRDTPTAALDDTMMESGGSGKGTRSSSSANGTADGAGASEKPLVASGVREKTLAGDKPYNASDIDKNARETAAQMTAVKEMKYNRREDYSPVANPAATLEFEEKMRQRIMSVLSWGGIEDADVRIVKMPPRAMAELIVERPVPPEEPVKPIEPREPNTKGMYEPAAAVAMEKYQQYMRKYKSDLNRYKSDMKVPARNSPEYASSYAGRLEQYKQDMKDFKQRLRDTVQELTEQQDRGQQHYAVLIDGQPSRFFGDALRYVMQAHGMGATSNPFEMEARTGKDERGIIEKFLWKTTYKDMSFGGLSGDDKQISAQARQKNIRDSLRPPGNIEVPISARRSHKRHLSAADLANPEPKGTAVSFCAPNSEAGQEHFLRLLDSVCETLHNQQPGEPDFLRNYYDLVMATDEASVAYKSADQITRKNNYGDVRIFEPRVTGVDPVTGLLHLAVKSGSHKLIRSEEDEMGMPQRMLTRLMYHPEKNKTGPMFVNKSTIQIRKSDDGAPRSTEEVVFCNNTLINRVQEVLEERTRKLEKRAEKEDARDNDVIGDLDAAIAAKMEKIAAAKKKWGIEEGREEDSSVELFVGETIKPDAAPAKKQRAALVDDFAPIMKGQLVTMLVGSGVVPEVNVGGKGEVVVSLNGPHARNFNKLLKESLRHCGVVVHGAAETKDYNTGALKFTMPADSIGKADIVKAFAQSCTMVKELQMGDDGFLTSFFDKIRNANQKIINYDETRAKNEKCERTEFKGPPISFDPQVNNRTGMLELGLRIQAAVAGGTYAFNQARIEKTEPEQEGGKVLRKVVKDGPVVASEHKEYTSVRPHVPVELQGDDAVNRVRQGNLEISRGVDTIAQVRQSMSEKSDFRAKHRAIPKPTAKDIISAELSKEEAELARMIAEREALAGKKSGRAEAMATRRDKNTGTPTLSH